MRKEEDVSEYHKEYKPPERYAYFNQNDSALFPIKIDVLDIWQRVYRYYHQTPHESFPDLELIEGYGLPPSQQKFKRETTPQELIELEKSVRYELRPGKKARELSAARREIKVIENIFTELEENQDKYTEAIEWLRLMWYYRLFGKFVFINGRATYIPGPYWFYCNYWTLNNNIRPEYRERDRMWSIAMLYCEHSTWTFKDIDPNSGLPVKNKDGEYTMVDIGRRTIFGANFPKARRVGDTSRISCFNIEFATRTMASKVGVQGMDDSNATTVFQEHCVYSFLHIPIWFKPVWDAAGGIAPKNALLFDDLDDVSFGLHSLVDYATSSDKSKYDGKFLHRFHSDEAGKMQRSDINEVIDVARFCLATGAGSNIHGLGAITTTVDEIESDSSGTKYMLFCQRSQFEKRDANGQTDSGYVTFFWPAWEGMQGYVGPYGESIIEKPNEEQIKFTGKDHGAKDFIENKEKALRRSKNFEGLSRFQRQHPTQYLKCFTPPPKFQLLRRDLVEQQIEHLQANPQYSAVRGNLFWKDARDGIVAWMPDEQGRFYMSRNFLPNETNQRVFRDGMYWPRFMDRFICVPDTFGVNKTLGRKSNGGILVRERHNPVVDPLDKDMDLWQTARDCITYCFRADTVEEYCEDVLMCAVYTSSVVYPERNRTNVIDHFRRRGYGGYLLYDVDRNTGKQKPEPGFWNKNELIDASIGMLKDDIIKNIKRCYHLDLLHQYLEFGGREYITDLDLIACKLGSLIAERNPFFTIVSNRHSSFDVSDWV